jgi:putative nucleotidyltransferase with HDIG domain
MSPGARRPPRLVVKVLAFSFGVITFVLAAVFLTLSWQTGQRLTRAIVESLEAGQQRVADREARRRGEQRMLVETLAESPTLKAAVDTFILESAEGGPVDQLAGTIQVELAKLQQRLGAPVVAVADVEGRILASAGPSAPDWRAGDRVVARAADDPTPADAVVRRAARVYLVTVVPVTLGVDVVADLLHATPIDDRYAEAMAVDAGTDVVILIDGRVVGASLSAPARPTFEAAALPLNGTVRLEGDDYVVRRVSTIDSARVYAVASIGLALRQARTEAAGVLAVIGLGAIMLAAAGSLWLARTLSAPIDDLTRAVAHLARVRDLEQAIPATGGSLELDALARTFDGLREALAAAEAESEATYLGVIGMLAAALDARDPYTAGHSERVAQLSVALGRQLGLSDREIDTLRVGALLHDIGKIGVPDAVLRKPGTLSDAEFEQIKRHPTLGARILKPLPFLADHLPIVELHHEQPDGGGYPYGLRGDAVPAAARIVHVADAFDAMVTARAYRPGRPVQEAMAELWRHAGTLFDADVVRAMAAIPASALVRPPAAPAIDAPGAVVAFRPSEPTRKSAG